MSVGLLMDARCAAMVVRAAQAQAVPLSIGRPDGQLVNAASMLRVVSLGVVGGEEVVLQADGDEAPAALAVMAELIARDLDEEE